MTDLVSHLDISSDAAAMLVLAGVECMFKSTPRWTRDEIAIMREHYPKGGRIAVRPFLPQKTDGAICQKARALKLRAPGYKRQADQWTSTSYIDDAIRRYYLGTPRKGGLSKLAHSVHRPVGWVSSRARLLGCQAPRFMPEPWSDAEIKLLRIHAAKVANAIVRLFRKAGFRRTAHAINIKRIQLNCDRSDDDHYSATALAGLFGVTQAVVSGWIAKGWLKAKTQGTTREHDIFRIHHTSVRRFVIENVGAIDIRRVDKVWFVDLIAGNG